MSWHLSIHISSKSMHAFLSNLANRQTQTDKQTRAKTCTSFVGGKYTPVKRFQLYNQSSKSQTTLCSKKRDYVFDDTCTFATIFGTLITESIGHQQVFFYFPTIPISCTYFTLGNCRDLNICKNLTKSWKFHRKMRFWFKIAICWNGMVHGGCWVSWRSVHSLSGQYIIYITL